MNIIESLSSQSSKSRQFVPELSRIWTTRGRRFDRFRFERTCDNSLSTFSFFLSLGRSRAREPKIDEIGSTGFASIDEVPVYVRNGHGRIIDRVDARQEVWP